MKLNSYLPELLEWSDDGNDAFVYFGDEHASDQLHVKQCGVMWCKSGYSYGPAARDHLLIHFVTSGKGEVSINEKRFEVCEGQFFILPPYAVSYYIADQQTPWKYYYVGFKGELSNMVLDFFRQDPSNMYLREFDAEKLLPLLEEMCSRMLDEEGYLYLMSAMYKLVGMLCDTHGSGDVEHGRVNRERIEPLINKAISRIEREYRTSITVQQIADDLGVNRSYLTEHFKRYTGKTIKGYITELRIRYAKMKIAHLQLSMQNVASECGYSDPLFFSRIFKKHVGCSPSEYRKRLESGEISENE